MSDRPRILIVEDEPFVLLDLQDIVTELGYEVVATAGHLKKALELCKDTRRIDIALLDMNLQGQRIDPVADALTDAHVPIVFLTGYTGDFEGRLDVGTILTKPCVPEDLACALEKALEAAR